MAQRKFTARLFVLNVVLISIILKMNVSVKTKNAIGPVVDVKMSELLKR